MLTHNSNNFTIHTSNFGIDYRHGHPIQDSHGTRGVRNGCQCLYRDARVIHKVKWSDWKLIDAAYSKKKKLLVHVQLPFGDDLI